MQKYCLILLFLSCLLRAPGQNTLDSIPAVKPDISFSYPVHFFIDSERSSPDTSLEQSAAPYPSSKRHDLGLGNIFTPLYPILFQKKFGHLSFSPLESTTSLFTDLTKLPVFSTNIPYTKLDYIAGMFNEQYVSAIHSRNFSKSLNVSAFIKLLAADGAYADQKNNLSSFALNTSYKPEKGNYSFLLSTAYEQLKIQENGGIASDSLFEDSSAIADLVNTRLAGPLNHLWHKEVSFTQYFNIRHDSGSTGFYLFHRIAWNDYIRSFTDTDADTASYYGELGINTDSTGLFDSLLYRSLSNDVGIRIPITGSVLSFWLTDGYKRTYHNLFDSTFNDVSLSGSFVSGIGRTRTGLSMKYTLTGWDKGGLHSDYFLKSPGDKNLVAELHIAYSIYRPGVMSQYYRSGYLNWTNNFVDQKDLNALVNLRYIPLKLNFSLRFNHMLDYVYWDFSARPNQSSQAVDLFQAVLKTDLRWQHLHFAPEIAWQSLSGAPVLSLPTAFAKGRLFIENMLFKKKMLLRLGADITWYSSFKAPAYNVLLMNYYLQNQASVGNYPWIDAYLVFKVAQARIFLIASHANANLMGRNYYSTPHYPSAPFTFRMGISWTFYD